MAEKFVPGYDELKAFERQRRDLDWNTWNQKQPKHAAHPAHAPHPKSVGKPNKMAPPPVTKSTGQSPTPAPKAPPEATQAATTAMTAMQPDEKKALDDAFQKELTSGYSGTEEEFLMEQAGLYQTAQEGDPRLKTWLSGDTLQSLQKSPAWEYIVGKVQQAPAAQSPNPNDAPSGPEDKGQRAVQNSDLEAIGRWIGFERAQSTIELDWTQWNADHAKSEKWPKNNAVVSKVGAVAVNGPGLIADVVEKTMGHGDASYEKYKKDVAPHLDKLHDMLDKGEGSLKDIVDASHAAMAAAGVPKAKADKVIEKLMSEGAKTYARYSKYK